MSSSKRLVGFDLLRGLAVALVIIRHAWPDKVGAAGAVGVVVFFTLSGYLITGLLLKDVRTHGKIDFKRFYRNRAIRLLPALLVMLVGYVVVTLLLNNSGNDHIVRDLVVAVTYISDIPASDPSPQLSHLWSLAVEEQFYIIWPLLLMVAIRWRKLPHVVIGSIILAIMLCGVSMSYLTNESSLIYQAPTSWVLSMMAGAVAAIWLPRLQKVLSKWRIVSVPALAIGLAGIIALAALPENKASPLLYLIIGPAASVLTVVVIENVKLWQKLPHRLLYPILGLGVVSYAAYLWNYPIALWMRSAIDSPLDSHVLPILGIALTIAAAIISWAVIEMPVARLRRILEARRLRMLEVTD